MSTNKPGTRTVTQTVDLKPFVEKIDQDRIKPLRDRIEQLEKTVREQQKAIEDLQAGARFT